MRALARRLLILGAVLSAIAIPFAPATADDDAELLGRIFLTPEQRRQLDQRRSRPALNADGLPQDLLPGRRTPSQRLVMNGLVRRGREAPVVWLNGERADDATQFDARVAGSPDRQHGINIELSGNGTRRLRPGQVWDLGSGLVSECLGCVEPVAAPSPAPVPATAAATPTVPTVPTTAQAAP